MCENVSKAKLSLKFYECENVKDFDTTFSFTANDKVCKSAKWEFVKSQNKRESIKEKCQKDFHVTKEFIENSTFKPNDSDINFIAQL